MLLHILSNFSGKLLGLIFFNNLVVERHFLKEVLCFLISFHMRLQARFTE